MAKPYNDRKLQLGEPLASKLRDFCAANYDAPAIQVIREAVDAHIDQRLEEPGMRARFERVRRMRLNQPEKVVKLLKGND